MELNSDVILSGIGMSGVTFCLRKDTLSVTWGLLFVGGHDDESKTKVLSGATSSQSEVFPRPSHCSWMCFYERCSPGQSQDLALALRMDRHIFITRGRLYCVDIHTMARYTEIQSSLRR